MEKKTDMKLEVIVIPVADVDRAKEFYARLGWRLDAEFDDGDDFRIIQFTPPGSPCSIIFGTNVTDGGARLRAGPVPRRLRHRCRPRRAGRPRCRGQRGVPQRRREHRYGRALSVRARRVGGPDPEHGSYSSFASFRDPDGNGWLFQEVTKRLAGRIDSGGRAFASANDLASAFRRAEAAHGEYEARIGQGRDANWPDWYAAYMVAEQSGAELPK